MRQSHASIPSLALSGLAVQLGLVVLVKAVFWCAKNVIPTDSGTVLAHNRGGINDSRKQRDHLDRLEKSEGILAKLLPSDNKFGTPTNPYRVKPLETKIQPEPDQTDVILYQL